MRTKRVFPLLIVALLALVLVGGAFSVFTAPPTAEAATYPITVNTSGVTASGVLGSANYNWSNPGVNWTAAEVWYSIDQGTTNTTTLRVDSSPDGSMWKTTHATVVSDNAADATGYITTTIAGQYFRIYATLANTNTVTPTVKVIFR